MNRIALVGRSSIAALGVVVLMGCGESLPDHKPVTGTVSFQGKPLAAARLRFIPIETTTGVGGHAKTDAEGKYRVVYAQGGNGLPPGKYKITVSQMLMPDGSPGPPNRIPRSRNDAPALQPGTRLAVDPGSPTRRRRD